MRDRIAWLLTRCIVGLVLLAALGGILVWMDVTDLEDVRSTFEIVGTVFCFVSPLLGAIVGYYFRAPACNTTMH
jgi:uncharacterized membrane protein